MYLVVDRVTPTVNRKLSNLSARNVVTKYWPTKNVVDTNGIVHEVMDNFMFYDRGQGGIIDTFSSRKIYKMLNTSVDSLRAESYSHVDKAFFKIKPLDNTNETYTSNDFNTFISLLPLNTELFSTVVTVYSPTVLTDSELQAYIKTTDRLSYRTNEPLVVSVALLAYKFGAIQFNTSFTTLGCNISYIDDTPTYGYRVKVESSLITSEVAQNFSDFMASTIETNYYTYYSARYNIIVSSTYSSYMERLISLENNPIVVQTADIFDSRFPNTPDDLNVVTTAINDPSAITTYVKKSTLVAMGTTPFVAHIINAIGVDYIEIDDSNWYDTAILIVLIVIMIAAFMTGQWWADAAIAAELGTVAAVSAFASGVALVTTLGMVALSFTAQYGGVSRNAVSLIGGSVQVLGMVSTVSGYIALITGIFGGIKQVYSKIVQQAATQGIVTATYNVVLEYIESLFSSAVTTSAGTTVTTTTASVLNKVLGTLNFSYSMYMQYIAPNPKNAVTSRVAELAQTNEEIEDLTTNKSLNAYQLLFESPTDNIYDLNEQMQSTPYNLTQGLVDNSTRKYYD